MSVHSLMSVIRSGKFLVIMSSNVSCVPFSFLSEILVIFMTEPLPFFPLHTMVDLVFFFQTYLLVTISLFVYV